MSKSCKWPLNEPIPTYGGGEGWIYHIHEDLMFGRVGRMSAKWLDDGQCLNPIDPQSGGAFDLIPPKREPRTTEVWVDWQDGFCVTYGSNELAPLGCEKFTLVHHDDRQPIKVEDIHEAITIGRSTLEAAEYVQALLKERGYE